MSEAVFRAGVGERVRLGVDPDDFAAGTGRSAVRRQALPESRACRLGGAETLARFWAGLTENRISLCGPMF
ncbi:hypothetical protein [Bosea sp. (in: a-proteobacteria)]|uniref:hypothetical protein n=1 Tax=Bosea sp. (in: a-proteobacteria) TaxID=1871050 RepID=UPI0027326C4F|nr:hypothetical protein [Bosea sp. (in: a-proteobacteria)]MDP3258435.1 hypothetical protein [Bosea sp. (in: a-proteobacteria)]